MLDSTETTRPPASRTACAAVATAPGTERTTTRTAPPSVAGAGRAAPARPPLSRAMATSAPRRARAEKAGRTGERERAESIVTHRLATLSAEGGAGVTGGWDAMSAD